MAYFRLLIPGFYIIYIIKGKSAKNEFWANFKKMAYFRLIFGHFPLIKTQNKKPMVLMVIRCPKLEYWYLGSLYIETIGFQRPAHKKRFFILWYTLIYIDISRASWVIFDHEDFKNSA